MKVLALTSSGNLELLAEMAWHYSSQVAMNREVVFLEIEKSERLYSAQEIVEGVQKKARELGVDLRFALGRSPAEAWAFLTFHTLRKESLPLEALPLYLDPFQKLDVSKLVFEMLQIFHRLGFKNFADFEKLPREGVASRFGAQGMWALQQVTEDHLKPWPQWRPQEVITESQIFDPDQRVQSVAALSFILKPLLDRTVARLLWRHEALHQLRLSLHLEEFSVVLEPFRDWNFNFTFAQTQSPPVLSVLKEKLEFELRKNPLESSVTFIEVTVLEKSPMPNRQKDFFTKKEEDLEAESTLISRLHQKMGASAIFKAATHSSYRPEAAWQKETSSSIAEVIPVPLRPLVLFKEAEPIRKLGSYLIYQHRKFRVLSWQGPERLSTEWWTQSLQRQYWTVKLEEGPRWWIYADAALDRAQNLFLHGVFD